ncbi:unnamed protein product, partial [Mesorhabditis spiculigera]
MCLQCEAGFLPALAADGSIRFCVGGTELMGDSRMASTCPGGYIRTGDLCWACRDLFPKCVGCDREGRCIQCERGYIPIHGHYRVTCVRLCTSLGCLECATGLYSMHQHIQDNTVICRYSCPLHYYPLNYFPFRCEPCHPSCWGCRGPTDRDCLDCKTVGFWDMRANNIYFSTTESLERIRKDPDKSLLNADYSFHSDIGIDQVCLEAVHEDYAHTCDPIAHFEDQLGHCLPCHQECLGCTGYGPAACKKCRHGIRDAEGCVPECHLKVGYHMTSPIPGMSFCGWEPLSSSHLPPGYAPRIEFSIEYPAVHVGVELLVLAGFFCYFTVHAMGFYASMFFGELDDADLICWRYEDIVQEAALRELEYLVFLRKTRTGSSSSFGPTSPPQARSSDTVPAVPSSSSNSKKALGPLAEPKPRVIVRPNLRTQARLNMRLKRNLELRKEEAKKLKAKSKSRSKSLSLGTTQESHQGTLDAKSFSRETGTGERTGTKTTMYTIEHPATVATTMRTVEQPAPATPHTSERRTTSAATPCPSSTDLGSHSAPALIDYEWNGGNCMVSGPSFGAENITYRCLSCPIGYDTELWTSSEGHTCKQSYWFGAQLLLPRNFRDLEELRWKPREGYCSRYEPTCLPMDRTILEGVKMIAAEWLQLVYLGVLTLSQTFVLKTSHVVLKNLTSATSIYSHEFSSWEQTMQYYKEWVVQEGGMGT